MWGATVNGLCTSSGAGISIHAPRVGSDRCGRTHACPCQGFQSTLPVWGATVYGSSRLSWLKISIHAPRVGSDRFQHRFRSACAISIHAPRVGSDRPGRRDIAQKGDFNPRSPCGERREDALRLTTSEPISIHAPRVGSDSPSVVSGEIRPSISIHAPRVGSDTLNPIFPAFPRYFNPRSPCGERH